MIELIKSNYDEQDGISYVKIKTNIGNFEGYAFLHDELGLWWKAESKKSEDETANGNDC